MIMPESRLEKYQKISKIILVLIATASLVLRIRKMIHYSMMGDEPSGLDWYMVCLWVIVIPFVIWELTRKAKPSDQLPADRIKVSRKLYREKQNQATGPLVVAGLAFLMLCFNGYMIFFKHKEADWDTYIWLIMLPLLLITWRIRENKLKKLQVVD